MELLAKARLIFHWIGSVLKKTRAEGLIDTFGFAKALGINLWYFTPPPRLDKIHYTILAIMAAHGY